MLWTPLLKAGLAGMLFQHALRTAQGLNQDFTIHGSENHNAANPDLTDYDLQWRQCEHEHIQALSDRSSVGIDRDRVCAVGRRRNHQKGHLQKVGAGKPGIQAVHPGSGHPGGQPGRGPPAYVSEVEVFDDGGGPDGPLVAEGYAAPPPGAYAPPPPPPPPDAASGAVGGAIVGGLLGGLLSGRPGGAIAGAVAGGTVGAIAGALVTGIL